MIKRCKICGRDYGHAGRRNAALTCSLDCSEENKRRNHRATSVRYENRHREKKRARSLRDYYSNKEKFAARLHKAYLKRKAIIQAIKELGLI